MAVLDRGTKARKLPKIALALCRNYWAWAFWGAALAALPFALIAWVTWSNWSELPALQRTALVVAVSFVLLFAPSFALLGAALGIRRDAFKRLPKNGYGLCTGTGPSHRRDSRVPPKDSKKMCLR